MPDTFAETSPIVVKKEPGKIRIGVVASRFNDYATKSLLDGCLKRFDELGVDRNAVLTVRVPGAFDITSVAQALLKRSDIDVVVALGIIVKGQTEHDRYIAEALTGGLVRLSIDYSKPVVMGILTTTTVEQALERIPQSRYYADVALELANTHLQLNSLG